MTQAKQIEDLAERARDLATAIREEKDEERTRNHAHQLRTHLGVALVLSETLAREADNPRMLAIENGPKEARVSYTVALDESNFNDLKMQ